MNPGLHPALNAGTHGEAAASLRGAFRDEIACCLIDGVAARPDLSVIAVVGDGMAGTPGIAASGAVSRVSSSYRSGRW